MSPLREIDRHMDRDVLGTDPRFPAVPMATPHTIEEAQELFQAVTKDRLNCVVLGSGSKLGWTAQVSRPEFAISTSKLSGVIEFEPGDGVLTALAGTPISELEDLVRPHGLCITPAIPRPAESTLGGMIAAGQSGFDRLLHGAMRLHVLGTRLVQLDGAFTRSGGRLVKNVSGYDIHRLLTGSFGSLGLIAEASLRLMTIPEDRRLFKVYATEPRSLVKLAAKLLALGIRPEALVIDGARETWELHLSLVGRHGHVASECALVKDELPMASVYGGAVAAVKLEALRHAEPDWNAADVLHIAVQRTHLVAALDSLLATDNGRAASRCRIHPGLATVQVQCATAVSANELQQLRLNLDPHSAQVTLRRAAPLSPDFLPPSHDPVRDRIATKLRQTYDPQNLLCTRPPLEPAQ